MRSKCPTSVLAVLVPVLAVAGLLSGGCGPSVPGPVPASKVATQNAALLAAVARGDLRAARRALDRGASPNAREAAPDGSGRTALMMAARACPEIVGLLLDRGADLKARDGRGRAALHLAVVNECVRLLLARGADVKAQDSDGRTPLYYAAMLYNQDRVRMMIEAGADPSARDRGGMTPLHVAGAHSSEATKALLAAKADPNAKDVLGRTPLHCAASTYRIGVILPLIAAGARVDERDVVGDTPLLVAVRGGQKTPAALLLESGADVNAADPSGATSLLIAVRCKVAPDAWSAAGGRGLQPKGSEPSKPAAVIALLLRHRADPRLADRQGVTPLHVAAGGDVELVRALIKAGAKVDSANIDGFTPLHYAARDNWSPAMLEALLQAGADPNAAGKEGLTPLMLLSQAEGRAFGRILFQGIVSAYKKRAAADRRKGVSVKEVADLIVPDVLSRTRGFMEGTYKHTASVLVRHKADLNVRDRQGRNALDHAVLNHAAVLAGMLVALGMSRSEVEGALVRRQEYQRLVFSSPGRIAAAPVDGELAKTKELVEIYADKDPLPNLRQTSVVVQQACLESVIESRGSPELKQAWKRIKGSLVISFEGFGKAMDGPPPEGVAPAVKK